MKWFLAGVVVGVLVAGSAAYAGGYYRISTIVSGTATDTDGGTYNLSGTVTCQVETFGANDAIATCSMLSATVTRF
jgi:hypothetical protein